MRKFIEVAYIVLSKEKKPLRANEITEKAIEQGLLETMGKTPQHSMRARLSTDILNNKEKSVFKRTESGKFALREWSEKEYHAPRHKKSLFDEDIVVFRREHLGKFITDNGLTVIDLDKIAKRINNVYLEIRRKKAEEDFTLIQLVSVFIVKLANQYLTFKRTKRLPESRLHGYYSIGFGGHISPEDFKPLFNVFDPKAQPFIIRELSEELKLEYYPSIRFRGLLYDDSKPVSQIHLGLVYDVALKDKDYEIGEKGFLMDPKFEDIQTIFSRIEDFENWSQIIIKEEIEKLSNA